MEGPWYDVVFAKLLGPLVTARKKHNTFHNILDILRLGA